MTQQSVPASSAEGVSSHDHLEPGSKQWWRAGLSWRRPVRSALLVTLRVYQFWISPATPPTCRFYPSCSAYAVTAVERFGVLRGGALALRRLLRCHPWSAGGVDHVPQRDPATGAAIPTPYRPTA